MFWSTIFPMLITISVLLSKKLVQTNSQNVNIPFDGYFHTEPILPFNTWGTFRGLTYFGLKTSSPDSPAFGLMWFNNDVDDVKALKIKHWCDASDDLKYFWKMHNFRDFGFQQINDNKYSLNTSFIKFSENNWKSLITSKSNQNIKSESLSIVLYLAKQRPEDRIKFDDKIQDKFVINGQFKYVGNFSLVIDVKNTDLLYAGYLDSQSSLVDVSQTLKNNLRPVVIDGRKTFVVEGGESRNDSSFIALQIVFKQNTEIEISFQSNNETPNDTDYDRELKKREKLFSQEFNEKFQLSKKKLTEEQINFAKSTLSEMIGSIMYVNGNQSVGSNDTTQVKQYGPLDMLSGIPSRPVFPHPFLWDDGFHNLVISRWNSSLTLKILKSWFNIMNIEGWIPRELTLDNEAKAKVDVLEHDYDANPPSFLLTIDSLINRNQIDIKYLNSIYPRLQAWFQWFNTSQNGVLPGTYRWRGRDPDLDNSVLNPGALNSGLDDYPRATHPTDYEYHLDLRCWLAFMSKAMSRIAGIVGDQTAKEKYSKTAQLLTDNQLLDKLHWSEDYNMYCDYGFHSTNVSLIPNPKGKGLIRKVWTPPKYQFACELGYVSLYPIMFNIIDPNNQKLGYILDSIENSFKLWTPYGLRSISKSNYYYNKYNDEYDFPYWRGPIWLNLNYLTLKGLHYYSQISGPNQNRALKIYTDLRNNIIRNMFNEYERTGFVWEQYNDTTGLGQRSHPFVGWSGLIVLIMSEDY